MDSINVINTNVDGGISGLKNQTPKESNQKQVVQKSSSTPESRSGDDDGVVIQISKQAQEQLKRDQTVQAEVNREAKNAAAKQFAAQEAAPPPPPPPAKEKPSLSFYPANQERVEARKEQAAFDFKELQRRLDGFVNYTTKFLARLSGVQVNLTQQAATDNIKEPAPQDLVRKLDLLA